VRSLEIARERLLLAGDLRRACIVNQFHGSALIELGAFEEAERSLKGTLATSDRMGLGPTIPLAMQYLGHALAWQGRLDEALAIETEALAMSAARRNDRLVGGGHIYLARIRALAGDPSGALREARAAADLLAPYPPLRARALALLSLTHRALGAPAEALAAAREALSVLDPLGAMDEGESLIRLAHAEALMACGHAAEARAALETARDRVLARAALIEEAPYRRSFLERVPDNARTLELARELEITSSV
jgi:tetratricopeptide (TPR) repeat protein